MRKTLLILITHKQPTGTKDFAVYVAGCTVPLWKGDQISCPHYYYNNKAKMLLGAEAFFLKQ